MSLHKNYAVFGLGRYGAAIAKELHDGGADVLAVDLDAAKVDALAPEIPFCKCADVTDPEVIRQLDVSQFDIVIIAIAGNLEASVMATALCKEAGVPTVIVKCAGEMQQKILHKVGADQVVVPETESGVRLAKNLLSSGFVDLVELTKEVSMVEITVRKEWVGKSLIELDLRKKYALNVVAIKQEGTVSVTIDPTMGLSADMTLIVIANTAKLEKLK